MFIKLHYFPQADEPLVTKCAGFNAWTPGARHYSLSPVTQADSRNRLSTLLRQSPFRLPIATGLPCTSPKDADFTEGPAAVRWMECRWFRGPGFKIHRKNLGPCSKSSLFREESRYRSKSTYKAVSKSSQPREYISVVCAVGLSVPFHSN
jgi:hypothetical protein